MLSINKRICTTVADAHSKNVGRSNRSSGYFWHTVFEYYRVGKYSILDIALVLFPRNSFQEALQMWPLSEQTFLERDSGDAWPFPDVFVHYMVPSC